MSPAAYGAGVRIPRLPRLPRPPRLRLRNPLVSQRTGIPDEKTSGSFGDGLADPGEVVWARIPYEEDPSQGKDRPALVLEVDGDEVIVLQMTSVDHDLDADQEASVGRFWMDIGRGAWDSRGRPSEVRLNRFIRLPRDGIRREGARLDQTIFDQVVEATRQYR